AECPAGGSRQTDRAQQGADFLPRRDMRHAEGDAGFAVAKVEQGQAPREQLAKDHALAEAGRQAEPDSARQLLEQTADVALVAGVQAAQTVPHDDPVDRPAIGKGPLLLLLPGHLAVEAGTEDAPARPVQP